METKMNYWSLIFSIACSILFIFISSTGPINYTILGTHPFILLLYLTLFALMLALIGMAGIEGWRGMARSISAIILTTTLSASLAFIIFFGRLLG